MVGKPALNRSIEVRVLSSKPKRGDNHMTYITSNKTIEHTNCPKLEQYQEYFKPLETPNLNQIPKSCRGCSQHPSNGGSGICFCILGQPMIT